MHHHEYSSTNYQGRTNYTRNNHYGNFGGITKPFLIVFGVVNHHNLRKGIGSRRNGW